MKKLLLLALLGLTCGVCRSQSGSQLSDTLKPGAVWYDTDNVPVNAHGGGVLFYEGKYYWFGEYKSPRRADAEVGVSCYSSDDLLRWKNEGVALAVAEEGSGSDIERGCILERPKVVYNPETKLFVMWFHLELKGRGYDAARSGVAISEKVTGPYRFLRSMRPNAGVWPKDFPKEWQQPRPGERELTSWTPEWIKAVKEGLYVRRDFAGGQMARDMTVFVDDNGKAYHIFASEENLTLNIAELSDDYQSHSGRYIRLEPAGHNEAPAIFKRKGWYFLITSGCTGWNPNAARMFRARSIWGPWETLENPWKGDDAALSFHSQSTYILPVEGKKDAYIFMADRWKPRNLGDSRYIWVPIQFENELPVLRWFDAWSLSRFK